MVRAKNYETVSTSVEVMQRKLWTFFPDTVYIRSYCTYDEGPQFSVQRGILSRAAEFAHFRGISMFSRNFAEFGTGR